MSTTNQILELEAEVTFYRDRVALLRARLYRQGAGNNRRLEELQRRLASAEQRLRAVRAAQPTARPT